MVGFVLARGTWAPFGLGLVVWGHVEPGYSGVSVACVASGVVQGWLDLGYVAHMIGRCLCVVFLGTLAKTEFDLLGVQVPFGYYGSVELIA